MLDAVVLAVEEGMRPVRGVVDDLVGHDERARSPAVAHAADGGDRGDALDAGIAECADVGAIVDAVWRHGVILAMARQDNDRRATERAMEQRR
jgi:hypothetical protein